MSNAEAFPDLSYFEVMHCEYCMERLPIERYVCSSCRVLVEAYKERERKLKEIPTFYPEDHNAQ